MKQSWFEGPEHTELLRSSAWSECEDRIRAFEQARRRGQPANLSDYLTGSSEARQALLIELVIVDLEFCLKAGGAARIEAYLEAHPELAADRNAVLELLAAEYDLRLRLGHNVSLDEFRNRFPQYLTELFERLSADQKDTRISRARSATTTLLPCPSVPGYEILHELGRGGMGIVYKAREPSLGRFVALKFLPDDVAHDPECLERFLREARMASALNHPHICVIHALGEHEQRPFIVMEFIEGETLQAQLARRPSVAHVTRWIAQVAQALATAHAAGVVHRDIKPENLMVRQDGHMKVLDFGLARRLPTLAQHDADAGRLTDPEALFGTVGYMSPEQANGQDVKSPSDIFSLGIVLYQLAAGQHPFQTGSTLGTLNAIATSEPVAPSLLSPEIPAALDGLIQAMLRKDPRLRPTAAEVENALTNLPISDRGGARAAAPRPIVHREPELAFLAAALHRADQGRGELVCVGGEPGIGKTTLVEDFLESSAVTSRKALVARGRCSERLAAAEAYMPVVEALQDLLHTASGAAAARLMKVVGPTWYVQLALASREVPTADPGKTASSEPSRASTRPALLREFRLMLEEVSRLGPVILFFDDVHWADVSTVDLLANLGSHCQKMRVLVIVTYRPTELLLGPHPFHGVKLDLETRGVCSDLSLPFLGRADVGHYLALAFPGHDFPHDFATLIHTRTEGNPLFVVDLLRYLQERGVLAESNGRWSLARELPNLVQELPGSVRSMIQRKLERLGEADRRLLAAASVQGLVFDSAVVAQALALETAAVDERLQDLDRVHRLVRLVSDYEFPDRTLTTRYAFVHSLYQQAFAAAMPASRRATLALALARALEEHFGEDNTDAAAALACLFEVGRDFGRAARHFWRAAQNDARVFAHREAVRLARRGLSLLEAVPDTPERRALELSLQTTLGLQLQVTEGFAAPEARTAYERARVLCEQLPGSPPLFPVLWGLWLFSKVRSELHRAQERADELLALATQLQDRDLALQAHQAMGMTAFCRGQPAAAVRHVEQANALYDPVRHQTHSFSFGQDPAVICNGFGAVALWLLGYPDRAVEESETTVRNSRALSPSSQAVALHFAAMLHQLRRDGRRAAEYAMAAGAVAAEHGFSFWLAGANIFGGWALAASGAAVEGAEQLRRGLFDWQATDSVTYQTYYLGLLAEVLAGQGHVAEPLRLLEEALALARQTGEGLYEPELYRLRGEVALRDAEAPSENRGQRAEQDFRRAVELARSQGAKSLELRAAVSLARLKKDLAMPAPGRELLQKALGEFTEGRDTQDFQDARVLLSELDASSDVIY